MGTNINCQFCDRYLFCGHPDRPRIWGMFKRQCVLVEDPLGHCSLRRLFEEPREVKEKRKSLMIGEPKGGEKSTLMNLESCLVDHFGQVDGGRMEKQDFENIKSFQQRGLLVFGRIPSKLKLKRTHWVEFTEEAWQLAHKYRKEQAERCTATLSAGRVSRTLKKRGEELRGQKRN